MPTQTNHAGPMSKLESINYLGQRLRGELNLGDLRKDLDVRGALDEFRRWYWTTHLGLDEIPESIHEEEVAALEKFIPALAADPIVKKILASKQSRGLWVPWEPPTRSGLLKKFPKARPWLHWEAVLVCANKRMTDGSLLLVADIEAAERTGRLLNIRESPDFKPFPPWVPIMLAGPSGYGETPRATEPAVPFPLSTGVAHKMVETQADQRRWDAQRAWYERGPWAAFKARMLLAILRQETHPRELIPSPPGPAADESLIRESRDAFIESQPSMRARRDADIETGKLRGGAEGESRARERWLTA